MVRPPQTEKVLSTGGPLLLVRRLGSLGFLVFCGLCTLLRLSRLPCSFCLPRGFYQGSKISLAKRTFLLNDSSKRYQLFSAVWTNLCFRYTTRSETH